MFNLNYLFLSCLLSTTSLCAINTIDLRLLFLVIISSRLMRILFEVNCPKPRFATGAEDVNSGLGIKPQQVLPFVQVSQMTLEE